MLTSSDLLEKMPLVRAAVTRRYTWFIHVTSLEKLKSIRGSQLEPRGDANPPPEVASALGDSGRNILCLHPLGARLHPKGTKNPPFASLAIYFEHLPQKIGLDWSYSWDIVVGRFALHPDLTIDCFVSRIVREFGSLVSYEAVAAINLRVCTMGASPTDPSCWPNLVSTPDDQVYPHR